MHAKQFIAPIMRLAAEIMEKDLDVVWSYPV
jgi:hypothetical protein